MSSPDWGVELVKLGSLVLLALNVLSAPVFVKLLREGDTHLATGWLLANLPLSILTAFFAGSVVWVMGLLLCLLSPLVAFFSFSLLVIKRASSFRLFRGEHQRSLIYIGGGMLIVSMQLSPIAGMYGVSPVCAAMTQRQGKHLIVAVESYQQDHGGYPDTLESLMPTYLSAMPSTICSQPFYLRHCPDSRTLLVFSSTNGLTAYFYRFDTKNWAGIDSLDFQVCEYSE